ncbi:MAG TPA: DUF4383 domain-containing protein [Sphingomicrobium sp.]|nr:DUF4383 domain-containing protein [Sphingomicrobium sp.]
MNTRTFALVWGIVFLGLTATGLIPGLLHPPAADAPDLAVDTMHGRGLGIWPFNILHTLVHLAFGIWGLVASRSWDAARTFAKAVAIVYGMFVVMGLIPGLNTTFGLVPLYGNDVWLHVLLAAPAAYFGFFHRDRDAGARS